MHMHDAQLVRDPSWVAARDAERAAIDRRLIDTTRDLGEARDRSVRPADLKIVRKRQPQQSSVRDTYDNLVLGIQEVG